MGVVALRRIGEARRAAAGVVEAALLDVGLHVRGVALGVLAVRTAGWRVGCGGAVACVWCRACGEGGREAGGTGCLEGVIGPAGAEGWNGV